MDDETTVEASASVEPGPAADTRPTDEPAAVVPPGRSRLAVAMFAVSGVLLIGAVVFGVLGVSAQSEASDERDRAAAAIARRHDLVEEEGSLDTERRDLEDEMIALPDKYDAVGASFAGLAMSHDHFIDVLNQAIDRYNAGDFGGGAAGIQGEASTAVTEVITKKPEAQQAVQAA
jgi:hypothetical protein